MIDLEDMVPGVSIACNSFKMVNDFSVCNEFTTSGWKAKPEGRMCWMDWEVLLFAIMSLNKSWDEKNGLRASRDQCFCIFDFILSV